MDTKYFEGEYKSSQEDPKSTDLEYAIKIIKHDLKEMEKCLCYHQQQLGDIESLCNKLMISIFAIVIINIVISIF